MLAIGISFENEGFAASPVPAEAQGAEAVEKYLRGEFGVRFDTILLVQNDEVQSTWLSGTDY